jgi:hypothetical protein
MNIYKQEEEYEAAIADAKKIREIDDKYRNFVIKLILKLNDKFKNWFRI